MRQVLLGVAKPKGQLLAVVSAVLFQSVVVVRIVGVVIDTSAIALPGKPTTSSRHRTTTREDKPNDRRWLVVVWKSIVVWIAIAVTCAQTLVDRTLNEEGKASYLLVVGLLYLLTRNKTILH